MNYRDKIKWLLSDIAYQQLCKPDCAIRYMLARKQMKPEKGFERVDKLISPRYKNLKNDN